jgi:hypothetical protein
MQFNKRRSAFTSAIFVTLTWLMYSTVIAQPQEQHRNICEKRKGLVIVGFQTLLPLMRLCQERFEN